MILSVSSDGYGKITELGRYRLQKRGGSGVLNMKLKSTGSQIVKSVKAGPESVATLLSSDGISIQFSIKSVRVTGRAASGVRLMRLTSPATVVDVQCSDLPVSNEAAQNQEPI